MKKERAYRYSLQFPGETTAQIRVGETLDRLGHRKSSFIVRAVVEYLDAHPEEEFKDGPKEKTAILTRNEVKNLIVSILNEMQLSTGKQPEYTSVLPPGPVISNEKTFSADAQQADIDEMLKNLDIFN